MRKKRSVLVLVVLSLFIMSSFMVTKGLAAQDIKVAFMVPLTGSGAFYGKLMRDVGLGVVKDINKEGIKGFGKIKVKVYDTATDPAIASQQMERAVSEGANIVWGGFIAGVEMALAAKADELKVPYVDNNSTADEAFTKARHYYINPYGGAYGLGVASAKYFIANGVKTYAMMGSDYAWTRDWDKTMLLELKGTGIKKIFTDFYGFSKVDFSADIAKLKQLKPDGVVRTWSGVGEYSGVKQMRDANYWPKYYVGELAGGCPQVMLDQLGPKYALGLSNVSFQNPDNPRWIAFAKEHLRKFGYRPAWFSDGIYDTLYLIKYAVEKAGTLKSDALMKAMRETSFQGVSGAPCGPFQECGLPVKTTVYILKWVKGHPAWSDTVPVHRVVVFKTEVKPVPYEQEVQLWKGIK